MSSTISLLRFHPGVVLERVWDIIKQVDPQHAELKHEISNTGGQDGSYTIQSGDNLT